MLESLMLFIYFWFIIAIHESVCTISAALCMRASLQATTSKQISSLRVCTSSLTVCSHILIVCSHHCVVAPLCVRTSSLAACVFAHPHWQLASSHILIDSLRVCTSSLTACMFAHPHSSTGEVAAAKNDHLEATSLFMQVWFHYYHTSVDYYYHGGVVLL